MFSPDVIRRFNRAGVKFAVVGGVAVNLHRYIRMTTDLDLVLEMTDENLRKAIRILKACGYTVKVPVDPIQMADAQTRRDWIANKNLKALNFYRRGGRDQIDIIVDTPVELRDMKPKRVTVRGATYPVASKEDLIRMKRGTGRDIDARDVDQLKRLIRLEKTSARNKSGRRHR